jgi:hypothetical protein
MVLHELAKSLDGLGECLSRFGKAAGGLKSQTEEITVRVKLELEIGYGGIVGNQLTTQVLGFPNKRFRFVESPGLEH